MFIAEYQPKEYLINRKWISSKATVLSYSEAAVLRCSYQENIFNSPSLSMPAYWLFRGTALYENNYSTGVYLRIFWLFSELLYIIDRNRQYF